MDVIANAVHLARIATGDAEEEYVNAGRSKVGVVRAEFMSPERRTEIAKTGADAR